MAPKGIAFCRLLVGIAIGGALGLIGSPVASHAKQLSLQDLLDGSAIVIGDKEFGGFRDFESEATGGADPVEPARVVVLPTLDAAGPGLRFVGNFFGERSVFHADVGQAQTTSFQYEVRTLSGEDLIIDETLALGRFVLLDLVGGRPIQMTETVRDELDQLLGEKFVFVSAFAQVLTDALAFAPQDRLVITTKIGLSGGTLDDFRQDFSQVPTPSTLSVFATSTIGLLGYARRRQKRCVVGRWPEVGTVPSNRLSHLGGTPRS